MRVMFTQRLHGIAGSERYLMAIMPEMARRGVDVELLDDSARATERCGELRHRRTGEGRRSNPCDRDAATGLCAAFVEFSRYPSRRAAGHFANEPSPFGRLRRGRQKHAVPSAHPRLLQAWLSGSLPDRARIRSDASVLRRFFRDDMARGAQCGCGDADIDRARHAARRGSLGRTGEGPRHPVRLRLFARAEWRRAWRVSLWRTADRVRGTPCRGQADCTSSSMRCRASARAFPT